MSLSVKTTKREIITQFVFADIPIEGSISIEGIAIGEHEIPLDHFCIMARHFLGGGYLGWGGKTPECVNDALSFLFQLYKKGENGKWIRKNLKDISFEP